MVVLLLLRYMQSIHQSICPSVGQTVEELYPAAAVLVGVVGAAVVAATLTRTNGETQAMPQPGTLPADHPSIHPASQPASQPARQNPSLLPPDDESVPHSCPSRHRPRPWLPFQACHPTPTPMPTRHWESAPLRRHRRHGTAGRRRIRRRRPPPFPGETHLLEKGATGSVAVHSWARNRPPRRRPTPQQPRRVLCARVRA